MGSIQMPGIAFRFALPESSCGYLLQELKLIWDEVGDNDAEREQVLLEIEQECLEVYRRKVDMANSYRAQLQQKLADSEAKLTRLRHSLGERSFSALQEKMAGTLMEQLDSITPALQELKQMKEERVKQFQEVLIQIQKISSEISGEPYRGNLSTDITVENNDLSRNKLEEYQCELQKLQEEKKERILRMEEYKGTLRNLGAIMGMDPFEKLTSIHASLGNSSQEKTEDISDSTLTRLQDMMITLKEEMADRLEKLQRLGSELTNLWKLLDTASEEKRPYSHFIIFTSATTAMISAPGSLALDRIQQVELEVKRLNRLKAYKMKELFLEKCIHLEEICRASHMKNPWQPQIENVTDLLDSGLDYADLLKSIDGQIAKSREEASSRKNIMDKVDKWMAARTEEHWLDEYNMDPNRYSGCRGAHKNLRRAERARITVNKIPGEDLLFSLDSQ